MAGDGSRVADLKLLSKERWNAHVEAQQALAAKAGDAFQPGPMPTPTAGALFNRPNPRDANGEFVLPYVRSRDEFVKFRNERMWVDADGFHVERPENPKDWQQTRKYVPVSGKDWSGVRIASHMKYRIPNTSVVNKVGDIKSFLCCGYRLTAAQWIWCDFAYLNLTHHPTQTQTRYSSPTRTLPHIWTWNELLSTAAGRSTKPASSDAVEAALRRTTVCTISFYSRDEESSEDCQCTSTVEAHRRQLL